MAYFDSCPKKIREHTRAVLCRGHIVSPSSERLADALYEWTRNQDSRIGDGSLQLIAHGEDLASEWQDKPFIVGVFIREVFGLDGDHRLGLTPDELAKKVAESDRLLDSFHASLELVVAEHSAELSARKLFFSWGGPLCSARLVKGIWRDGATDDEYYWSVKEGKPAYYFSRQGGSQDEAPGGAWGFQIAAGFYDNSTPPFELTPTWLGSADAALNAHGIKDARYFVFSHYD